MINIPKSRFLIFYLSIITINFQYKENQYYAHTLNVHQKQSIHSI